MDEGSVPNMSSDEPNLYQPDQIIRPNAPMESSSQVPAAPAPNPVPQPAPPMAAPSMAPSTPTSEAPAPLAAAPVEASSEPATQPPEVTPEQDSVDDKSPITWKASEFIASQKSSNWYTMLGVAAVVIGAVVWLLTRDFYPTIAVLIGVILLGVYAGRQPRQETYSIDSQGLTVGGRHFGYHEFRSFALVPDGAFISIQFTPLKRFASDTTVYVDPADEDRIINRLSQYLPMEEAKPSLTDNVMRRIKF